MYMGVPAAVCTVRNQGPRALPPVYGGKKPYSGSMFFWRSALSTSEVVRRERLACFMYLAALCAMSRMRYSMSVASAVAMLSRRLAMPSDSATSFTESFGYTDDGMLGPNTGAELPLAPNVPFALLRFAPPDDDIVGDEKAHLHYDDPHRVVRG